MKKIIFCIVLFITLISSISLVAFADNSSEQDEYVIIDGSYSINVLTQYVQSTVYFNFSFMNEDFIGLEVDGDYGRYYYLRTDGSKLLIYNQGDFEGGIDRSSPLLISGLQVVSLTSEQCLALDGCFHDKIYELASSYEPDVPNDPDGSTDPVEPASGVYYDIYDIFVSFVYGDGELTSDMRFTATLISTCLCCLVFLLPIILTLWVCKFIFSWRF